MTASHMEDAIRFVIDRELYGNGLSRRSLAVELNVSQSTIKRQMEGRTPPGGLDLLVSTTARLTGQDVLELWRSALTMQERNGDDADYWRRLKASQNRLVRARVRSVEASTAEARRALDW